MKTMIEEPVILTVSHYNEIPVRFSGRVLFIDGTNYWYLNGQLHREDGPARISNNGAKMWWRNGLKHREDGPAIEWADGGKNWYLNNICHREDGPAIEFADGTKHWYFNGYLCYNSYHASHLLNNCVVLERGIPTDKTFGNIKMTQAKLLTEKGTIFVPDNLPGMVIEG